MHHFLRPSLVFLFFIFKRFLFFLCSFLSSSESGLGSKTFPRPRFFSSSVTLSSVLCVSNCSNDIDMFIQKSALKTAFCQPVLHRPLYTDRRECLFVRYSVRRFSEPVYYASRFLLQKDYMMLYKLRS